MEFLWTSSESRGVDGDLFSGAFVMGSYCNPTEFTFSSISKDADHSSHGGDHPFEDDPNIEGAHGHVDAILDWTPSHPTQCPCLPRAAAGCGRLGTYPLIAWPTRLDRFCAPTTHRPQATMPRMPPHWKNSLNWCGNTRAPQSSNYSYGRASTGR